MFNCFICNNKTNLLFTLGDQPLANKYPKSEEDFDSEIVRKMDIYYCQDCNYVNVPCDVDRSLFFEDYYYLSSINKELVEHFEDLALYIKNGQYQLVVDIGSNDGILLQPLRRLGINCVGVDPSENVSAIANAAGLDTIVGFFDNETATAIQVKYGKPDLICASSVFTHLDSPGKLFQVADEILAEDGEILIEVEYLGSIIDSLGFERFYFDRPHYYSINSLRLIAEKYGYFLVDATLINIHGGSVRAIFRRIKTLSTNLKISNIINEEFDKLNNQIIIEKFEIFKLECRNLFENLQKMKQQGLKVAGYGCPARFSTITNFASIGVELLPFVVEDSNLKQGRYSPGKHIPIISFSSVDHVDIFMVFAYEYITSIKSKLNRNEIFYYRPIPFLEL
jgi:methylation protein EvaC